MDSEFSRRIAVAALDGDGECFEIEADARERTAIAERLDVLAVDRLEARIRLIPVEPGRIIRLEGLLHARAVQRCVVSLQPVDAEVKEAFTVVYSRDAADDADAAIEVELDDAASPEPLHGEHIDIGEAVTQQLALALDPYPRLHGAVPPPVPGADAQEDSGAEGGAFAALAALKTSK